MQPKELNIEKFNELVKNIRNAHRTATDDKNDTTFLEAEKKRLVSAVQKAAAVADVDEVTARSADLRRVLKKLEDGPQEAIAAFETNMAEIKALVSGEVTLTVVEDEAQEKVA